MHAHLRSETVKATRCVAVACILAVMCVSAAVGEESPAVGKAAIEAFPVQGLLDPGMLKAEEEQAGRRIVPEASDHEQAIAYNDRAIYRYYQGKYPEALEDLGNAVKRWPMTFFYGNRGMVHRALDSADKARADYEKAVELDPDNRNRYARSNLGWLLLLESHVASDADGRKAKVKEAEKHLLTATAVKGSQTATDRSLFLPLAYINLASLRLADQKVVLAEESLRQVRRRYPDENSLSRLNPVELQCLLLNEGEVARCKGEWKAAQARYQEAYDLSRDKHEPPPPSYVVQGAPKENPWILQRLGAAEFVNRDYVQSAEHLGLAAEKFGGGKPAARYCRLLAALALAHEGGEKSIVLPPGAEDSPERWVDGLFLYVAGKWSDENLAKAAEDEDDFARRAKRCEMHFYRAQKLLLEGKNDDAKAALKQCIQEGRATHFERTMAEGIVPRL